MLLELIESVLNERKQELETVNNLGRFRAKLDTNSKPRVSIYKSQARALTALAKEQGVAVDEMIHKILIERLGDTSNYEAELKDEVDHIINQYIEKKRKV